MASLSIDGNSNYHGKPSSSSKHQHHGEAKAEAKARHKDIAAIQFRELQYWLGFLDDLLSCEIRAWNARLVEWLLREVIVGTVLLRWNCSLQMMSGGASGGDECMRTRRFNETQSKVPPDVCKAKAEARVSMVFLTQ